MVVMVMVIPFFSPSPSSSDVGIEVDFKVRIHEI